MIRNQRIKAALKTKGITRERLAEALGVTHATITQRLNAKADVDSIEFIQAVSKLTGYNFEYLMAGIWSRREVEGDPTTMHEPKVDYLAEVERLQEENKSLKHENEVLRSALREIGRGNNSPTSNVG